VYYQFMDDAVNAHLIDRGIGRSHPRFVAENGIKFHRPISGFPRPVHVGLRVLRLGSSSVVYRVGFFFAAANQNSSSLGTPSPPPHLQQQSQPLLLELAAVGKYVHVYVDEGSGRPIAIPEPARKVLQELVVVEGEVDAMGQEDRKNESNGA
jgi:acyl-CoA thioester hydrolase